MMKTKARIQHLVETYGSGRENLLPILQHIVREDHFLHSQVLEALAHEMQISAADVYGTASFYSFLETEPRGRHIIRVCKTISCYMKGKDALVAAIEERLKIRMGETTRDGRFSLLAANCMGWCHKGPAMLIDEQVYTELTPEGAVAIIEQFMQERRVPA